MKKYGLQLRVQPQQKKQPVKPSAAAPLGFNDDDDDNVEREILRQAYKNKTDKDVEEQHQKALEEDPSVFDYDGVYDKMKEKQARPVEKERQDRKPRYIQALMDKAKQREREHEVIYERKLAKERSQDEHMYADKDKFVTSAYKRKLAEQAKWMEEERLREMREEKEDVTKKTDITDFYFNLHKNRAFGADEAGPKKPEKRPEKMVVESSGKGSPPAIGTSSESSTPIERHQDGIPENIPPMEKSDRPSVKPSSETSTQVQVTNEEPSASSQPKPNHHKKSEDAVAAAKERFLARKKAKV